MNQDLSGGGTSLSKKCDTLLHLNRSMFDCERFPVTTFLIINVEDIVVLLAVAKKVLKSNNFPILFLQEKCA